MQRFLSFFLVVICLATSVPTLAHAQEAPETLAIEVALMYDKLMKIDPSYDTYIRDTGIMQDEEGQFGQTALLEQQRRVLKSVFDKFNDKTVFYASKSIPLTAVDQVNRTVTLTPVSSTDPILFPLNDNRTYGIFIRNAKDLEVIGAPFVFEEIDNIAPQIIAANVDLILHPVAADPHQFTLEDGKSVSVILADVVEIKMHNTEGRMLLQKRFNNWEPANSSLDILYQPQQ